MYGPSEALATWAETVVRWASWRRFFRRSIVAFTCCLRTSCMPRYRNFDRMSGIRLFGQEDRMSPRQSCMARVGLGLCRGESEAAGFCLECVARSTFLWTVGKFQTVLVDRGTDFE